MFKKSKLVEIRKAFKFRIYPNHSQQAELARQFGCARFVYNHYRAVREGFYIDCGSSLSYNDCQNDLTQQLKVEYPWLKEADSQVLQAAIKDLDRAYVNFFAGRADYPNFHDKQSIRYPQRFKVNDGSTERSTERSRRSLAERQRVYLPKVGWVKTVSGAPRARPIEGAMKNCTVTRTKSGRYFVSIQCELEVPDPTPKVEAVGIDLGLTTFAALSTGEKIEKPKYLYRSQRRLQIRQRRLSRKQKGSKHRNHARLPVAVLHERVANQRKDFQHKLSRTLVDRFGSVSFESLNVAGMVKNHHLAKSISDASWSQFVTFVEYTAAGSGAQVLRVDRSGTLWVPSSKLCSNCGHKNKNLTLNIRQWVCLNCGVIHDRDTNAAINILRFDKTSA